MVVFVNNSSPRDSPRRFLVRGNWSLSWRNSKKDLVESNEDSKSQRRPEPRPKRVQFEDEIAKEISIGHSSITSEELAECWYKESDYSRFEKDRVLTSLGYMARQRIGGISFDDNLQTTRGIENMCDAKLSRRQIGERKDLTKAMNAEERRQKAEGSFPDLDAFRAVSLKHSKAGRDRAIAVGQQDAWAYRPKPKNPMVGALARVALRRKNSALNSSGHVPTTYPANDSMERRRSFG